MPKRFPASSAVSELSHRPARRVPGGPIPASFARRTLAPLPLAHAAELSPPLPSPPPSPAPSPAVSSLGRPPGRAPGVLPASCGHDGTKDRGVWMPSEAVSPLPEYVAAGLEVSAPSRRAAHGWRVVFCDRCWMAFCERLRFGELRFVQVS